MSQEFTLLISACGPVRDNDERGKVIINWGAGSSRTVYPPNEECKCGCPSELKNPRSPYNLKECPSPSEQEEIYAWDCETSYEAKNPQQAVAHDQAVRPTRIPNQSPAGQYPDRPAWIIKTCKKCKCPINAPFTIDWSYDDGPPCGSGHSCDRAVFNFGFLRGALDSTAYGGLSAGDGGTIALGTFNLNNGGSGGPVKSPRVTVSESQFTNALFKDENGNTCVNLYVRCALDDCHQGISHCVMKDSTGATLIDACFDQGETKVIICKVPDPEENG